MISANKSIMILNEIFRPRRSKRSPNPRLKPLLKLKPNLKPRPKPKPNLKPKRKKNWW